MYGAECTAMSMLVSSSHPAKAGLQAPLVELLLDFGAAIEGPRHNEMGKAAAHRPGLRDDRCRQGFG
jgi:hypothetical protein